MTDLINQAIAQGATLWGSISGGKDGQAMARTLARNNFKVTGFIHADLGRVEWAESLQMCQAIAAEFGSPLHIVKRSDGRDLLDHWAHRLGQLKGTGKPFWSSASERYCTSDMKRDPIDKFFRNCGSDFLISCEGIRAQESAARSKKEPLSIRKRITSKYYAGMTPAQAIAAYKPGERLALTWYPIFNFSDADVWATYHMSAERLELARMMYRHNGKIENWWPFHPAYVFGNDRVSCKFCVLASLNDLQTGARHDEGGILPVMIQMEKDGQSTFRKGFSLERLLTS